MSVRRRLALLIDPSLSYRATESQYLAMEIGAGLDKIEKTLRRIERNTPKRRPRVIECKHPELHPELEQVA